VIQDMIVYLTYILLALVYLLLTGVILTWVERKQGAIMADRIGANRAYIRIPFTNIKFVAWGLFHAMADGGKMLLKENFMPNTHDKLIYRIAPWATFTPVLLAFAVIPFGGKLTINDTTYDMQISNLDGGILVILAISGLSVIGSILAGWSSNNKFSLMGSIRAASQMISYEIALGLAVLSMILVFHTLNLGDMARAQSSILWGYLPAWGIIKAPLAALLFMIAAIAENKRAPFDLPEAESELIAGYFTEYTGMKMGLFMFAEFIEIAVISAVFVTIFLGGYNLPFMSDAGFMFPGSHEIAISHYLVVAIQLITFIVKVLMVSSFQVQVRWTLPRFRYDQLLQFGWKLLLPLGVFNLMVTVLILWLTN